MATAEELAYAAADNLRTAAGSLRAAAGFVEEVHDRLSGYGDRLRTIRSAFGGEPQQRYDQLNEARGDANRLSGSLLDDQRSLDTARQHLGAVRGQVEQAGNALQELQQIPGHDERLVGAQLARLDVLRRGAFESDDHLETADRRIGAARDTLNTLDRDGYLNSAMDGESLSRQVGEIREQTSDALAEARVSVAESRGGLAVMPGGQGAMDAELLAAQKGLNPTAAADQRSAAGQGEQDLRSRTGAGLDGADRGRD